MRVDMDYLDRAIKKTSKRIERLEKGLRETDVWRKIEKRFGGKAKLERNQIAKVLFGEMKYKGVEVERKGGKAGEASKRYIADEAAFANIDIPFVHDYRQLEKLRKVRSTYLYGVRREVVDGYIHPNFNLHTTNTFRSSSDHPNFQNWPIRVGEIAKIVRSCFIARPGHVITEIDFKGIEVCGAACYNKDPTLISYIKDSTKDMHRDMAAECFKVKPGDVSKMARYCNPPEAPMWMANGTFKPLGKIKVGDKLMGWKRAYKKKGKRGNRQARKRLCVSVVTAVHKKRDKIYKITMASGRVLRCTKDHLWVNGKLQFRGKDNYVTPEVGRTLAHIVEPPRKLTKAETRTAGWLGGVYDGEGSGRHISQSQTHNPEVCDKIEHSLRELEFEYSVQTGGDDKCAKFYIAGGIQGDVNFLNHCQPARKKNWLNSITNRSSFFKKDTIVKIEADSYGDVLGLTTTTGNYICWGYASKNCAKNMFVFPQFYGSWYIDCARNLWEAIDKHKLEVNGTPMAEHLKKKGITHLGALIAKQTPLTDSFEYHLKKVEQNFWGRRFKVYSEWKYNWNVLYRETGCVKFLTGFEVRGILNRKQVTNYPIQGTAFHWLLWVLIELQKWMNKHKMRSKIVGQIHDSIVMDIHLKEFDAVIAKAVDLITNGLPEHYPWINVPLNAEVEVAPEGGTWFDKKEYKFAS